MLLKPSIENQIFRLRTLLCIAEAFSFVSTEYAGLIFGEKTIVNNGRAYHMVNETLEVTCAPPTHWSGSPALYFEVDHVRYSTPSQGVTVVNGSAIHLVMRFHRRSPSPVDLSCLPLADEEDDGEKWRVELHVNYGLLLATQSVTCRTRLPGIKFAPHSVVATIDCDLTIGFNIVHSFFSHTTYFSTTRNNDEITFPRASSQQMPIQLKSLTLSLPVLLNASELFFRTSVRETFSGRETMLRNSVSVLDSLQLPLDVLQWKPLENGTGFRVVITFGYLREKCSVWRYLAAVRIQPENNGINVNHEWLLTCRLCNETCQTTVDGLEPGANYSVQLWHRLISITANDRTVNRTQTQHRLYLQTSELEPLAGPEMQSHYLTYNCSAATTTCVADVNDHRCRMIKVFWQAVGKSVARGHIVEYRVNSTRNGLFHQSFTLPPSELTADVCWDGNSELRISVAGKTTRGYPQASRWGTLVVRPGTSEGVVSPLRLRNGHVEASIVTSVLLLSVLLLVIMVTCLVKGYHYRRAWSSRLRIPSIKPSCPSSVAASPESSTATLCTAHWEQRMQSPQGIAGNNRHPGKIPAGYTLETTRGDGARDGEAPSQIEMVTDNRHLTLNGDDICVHGVDAATLGHVYPCDWQPSYPEARLYLAGSCPGNVTLDLTILNGSGLLTSPSSCAVDRNCKHMNSLVSRSPSLNSSSESCYELTVSADEMRKLLASTSEECCGSSTAFSADATMQQHGAFPVTKAAVCVGDREQLFCLLPEEQLKVCATVDIPSAVLKQTSQLVCASLTGYIAHCESQVEWPKLLPQTSLDSDYVTVA